jgi:hypothetical protein
MMNSADPDFVLGASNGWCDEPRSIGKVGAEVAAKKIFRNGQILILVGENTYTIMGQKVSDK